jgi:hypothetical protein
MQLFPVVFSQAGGVLLLPTEASKRERRLFGRLKVAEVRCVLVAAEMRGEATPTALHAPEARDRV